YVITEDNTLPNVTIITPLDSDLVGWTVLLRANATDLDLANVTYEIRNGTISASVIASGYMNNIGGDIFNATLVTNATWPYNNTLLNSTNLTLVVYANDTSGNQVNASTYWILDNTKPNIQHLTPPQNGAFYNSDFNLNIWLSNTLLNYSEYNITNSSGSIIQQNSTNLSSITFTWLDAVDVDSLADGNYTLTTSARDYISNNNTKTTWFYIDTTPPNTTEFNETGWIPPTPANNTYTSVQTHTFNMTCNESFIDTVWIDFNGTINSTPQNLGTSYWWIFTLSPGTYTYTGYCNDTASNTRNTETRILNIDTSPPYWFDNTTSIVTTYSSTTLSYFNISWGDDYGVSTVWFESNYSSVATNYSMNNLSGTVTNGTYNYSAILPAGTHYWKSYANDTSNNWNDSDTWPFTIAKASSSCSLLVSSSPVTYGTQTQANCTCDSPEAAAVLYKNGTDVTATENNTLTTLPGGNWYYVCNVSETQNYTTATNNSWINITRAATSMVLYINGSTADYTKNVTFDANLTCILNVSGNVNITQDGSQIAYGASPLQNISTYSTTGNYSINCSYAESQNYTASSDSSIIYAVDQVNPNITLAIIGSCQPDPANISDSVLCTANVTDDVQVDTVLANVTHINSSELVQSVSCSGSATLQQCNFTFTQTTLPGVYNVTWWANDTSSNTDTDTDNFTVQDVDSLNVVPIDCVPDPANISNSVLCTANVTDDVQVDTVLANVTHINSSILSQTVACSGSATLQQCNFTFTQTTLP
ncbi:MAG: hypothetical protein KKC80_08680, partial [Candidatus Margulisbacteria bacterium]|nr:hypothetical protein [Candidatus Margulisiibacteriota bacterium]